MQEKAWLLKSEAERTAVTEETGEHPGLLACGVYSAMQKNQDLRDEVMKLQKNLDDAVHLIGVLNSKIAILSTLNKHGTGQNPTPTN
jgi:hypothetical protein